MKSSRAMLLAAMLFVAPAFADEVGQVQNTQDQQIETAEAQAARIKAEEAAKAEKAKLEAEEAARIKAEQDAKAAKEAEEAAKLAQDTPKAPEAEDKNKETKTEKPSWFAAKWLVLTGFGTTVSNYTVTPVAEWTTIPVLKQLLRISYLKGGRFESSIPTVGKSIVALGAVAAAYKIYQATQDQDETDEDEMFSVSN